MEGSCHQTKTVSKHKFARFYVPLGIYTGSILDKSLKNRQSIDEVTFITDKIPKLLPYSEIGTMVIRYKLRTRATSEFCPPEKTRGPVNDKCTARSRSHKGVHWDSDQERNDSMYYCWNHLWKHRNHAFFAETLMHCARNRLYS